MDNLTSNPLPNPLLPLLRAPWTGQAGPADLDPELVQHALAQGVGPLLYGRLRGQGRLPAAAAEPLRQAYYATAARNARLLHELAGILDALEAAHIPVLLLKGAALALAVYDNPALRPMGDVDLLVHPHDTEATLQVLATLGYHPVAHEPAPGSIRTYENELMVCKEGGAAPVEVHWGLFDSPHHQQHIQMAWFWETAVAVLWDRDRSGNGPHPTPPLPPSPIYANSSHAFADLPPLPPLPAREGGGLAPPSLAGKGAGGIGLDGSVPVKSTPMPPSPPASGGQRNKEGPGTRERAPTPRMLGPAAQLLHLCAHLVLHHGTGDLRLLWLHDVAEVLVRCRDEIDWPTVLAQARAGDLLMPLQQVLPRVARDWQAPVPPAVLEELSELAPSPAEARIVGRLADGYRPAGRRLWDDLVDMPSWPQRLHMAWVNVFPTPAYMRQRYEIRHPLLVPFYYPYRWLIGLRGLFASRSR